MSPTIQSVEGQPSSPPALNIGDAPKLEFALVRRSLGGLCSETDACARCERHMLIGEMVFEDAGGELLCALCRQHELGTPARPLRVHGPAFGHSIRVIAARAA